MNCIYNKKPEVMGLRRILETYTEYKWEVYTAKYERLLADQRDVREVKSGLLEAVDVIDLIIEILRGSATTKEAKECLMFGKTDNIKFRYKGSVADAKELHFTEKQTDAILAMRLQKLIGLEVDVLKKELEDAEKKIAKYEKLLKSNAAMKKQMVADIEELKKKYAIPRRSVIENLGEVVVEKEKVVWQTRRVTYTKTEIREKVQPWYQKFFMWIGIISFIIIVIIGLLYRLRR